ncbi:MAG: acyl-CoA dehydrogenase family protein [Myxococcota bacterium]|nr:acyl-CoA dehydrogenase family protein [Myxococcota bacterium]
MESNRLTEIVRDLLPGIRERAARAESERRLPEETRKAFLETGLLRALQPARFGGLEQDPLSFYEAVMEVGTACGSSAWVLGVVGVHNWQLALFDERAQHDVWRDDPTVQISSSYAPTGRVEPASGGFVLSGRWSFSSGCDHCDWVFLGGLVPLDDGVELRTFLLPRSDYLIDDNWHVMGLRGTGSKDIVVEEAFVPEHRTHSFGDAFVGKHPGSVVNPGPIYRLPFGCVFCSAIAAPAVGVARGAVEEVIRQAEGRISTIDGSSPAQDATVVARLGEAGSEVEAAAAGIRRPWRAMSSLVGENQAIPLSLRADCRSSVVHAVEWSVRATLRVFQVAGSRAIFDDNPLQRALRDVIAIRAHAMNHLEKSGSLRAKQTLGSLGGEQFL